MDEFVHPHISSLPARISSFFLTGYRAIWREHVPASGRLNSGEQAHIFYAIDRAVDRIERDDMTRHHTKILHRLLCGPALLAAAFILMAAPTGADASATDPSAVLGVWMADTEKVAVELYECDGNLCGKIVWLAKQLRRDGKIKRDDRNPNPALRDRPQCGIQVVWNLKPKKNGVWEDGKFYFLKRGATYDLDIKLKDKDRLELLGYMGTKLFGMTDTWKRPDPNQTLECLPET